MIAYLDSNVIDYIAKCGDAKLARAYFDRKGAFLLASEIHILETVSIPDSSIRLAHLKALTLLASRYTATPLAYRHAQELRFEIVRCRRKWLTRIPFTRSAERFLRQHKSHWKMARNGELPLNGLSQYRNDSEFGIKKARDFQKMVRSEQVNTKKPRTVTNRWEENGRTVDFDLDDPESFWRAEGAMVWYEAIVRRQLASRDYADYLGPYIKEDAFCDGTYASFWSKDVDPRQMPLNRITGLASYFQLKAKIGHGNTYDAQHANLASECDLFLTCDKAFFHVLSDLHQYLGEKFARPVFIDRNVSDVCAELEQKLDSLVGTA